MFKVGLFGSLRNKEGSSKEACTSQNEVICQQLIALFPDADQRYLLYCIDHYNDNHVERISEKIFTANCGFYPQIPHNGTSSTSTEAKNAYLDQLNELFPDCEVSFIRDLINSYDNNHVHQVTEELIALEKSSKGYPRRLTPFEIESWEYIRSDAYIKAVRCKLYNDFPNMWKSTIKAVLAENNFDYIRSHDKLKDLSTNGWWTLFNVFKRKSYKETDNAELNGELERLNLIEREKQSLADHEIAKELNHDEYSKNNQLITCGCCYGDCTFEELTFCSEGHLFCKECINRLVEEGVFGQGSLRGKRIKCIEASDCNGYFRDAQLRATLFPSTYKHYTESLIEHSLKQSNLPLVQCPFCQYAEVEDDPLRQIRISRPFLVLVASVLVFFLLGVIGLSLLNFVIIIATQIALGLIGVHTGRSVLQHIDGIIKRIRRRRRGNVFRCLNPECGKVSCLLCNRESRPHHKCYEKEQDSLRLYVERAMAEAVKRTCPKCHVSFTKADGCNKMTCRCGYVMCYLCRKDLRQESYAHFCDHFRPVPGQKCKKCNKCDLYKPEDEEKVVREAATKARAEFMRTHPEFKNINLLDNTAIGPRTNEDNQWVRDAIERTVELVVDYILPNI
ncbi:10844_t:CDS:2 [Paraglomus brasilianum]|uniref:10844_t:CDS:1 n=1 Tax=Paraglomus brasilianum TaxID=144538 RepID=A0A9N9BGC1_9GLOM|nr:10844_t:CDS:2 [Paraglomus brasilianum]